MRALPPAIDPRSSTEPEALRQALALIKRCRNPGNTDADRGRQPPSSDPSPPSGPSGDPDEARVRGPRNLSVIR